MALATARMMAVVAMVLVTETKTASEENERTIAGYDDQNGSNRVKGSKNGDNNSGTIGMQQGGVPPCWTLLAVGGRWVGLFDGAYSQYMRLRVPDHMDTIQSKWDSWMAVPLCLAYVLESVWVIRISV